MQISCIIPVYNNVEHLQRAVTSLRDCGLTDLEIIIVDDGSTDGSVELAASLAEAHDGVRFLQHPGGRNRGVSETRNLGIRESTGEFLSFLDADDYVYPHRYTVALSILREHSQVDGVYDLSEIVFADSHAQSRWRGESRYFGFTSPILHTELILYLLKGRCWATSAIVFRKSLLARTGLFESKLRIAEDCHLWFRMAVAGTLAPGDLSSPVSVYWRTSDSAFQPAPVRRLDMLRAMSHFYDWVRGKTRFDVLVPSIRSAIHEYAIQGVIAARSTHNNGLAWRLLTRSLMLFPSIGLNRTFQRQAISLLFRRKIVQ